MNKKLGHEPAFPKPWSKIKQSPDAPEQVSVAQSGISKRYLTAKDAMCAILSNSYWIGQEESINHRKIVAIAYRMTDELLKQENE